MDNSKKINKSIKYALDAVRDGIKTIDDLDLTDVSTAVEIVSASKGKIVVSGVGKSGIVARKMVATLNSIGRPSVFLHAGDALHGDIGVVADDDVLFVISKSGHIDGFGKILDLIKSRGVKVISLVNARDCDLIINSDHFISLPMVKEADTTDIIPSVSIILQLAVVDAICVALMDKAGFTSIDFGIYHPHGVLGKKLHLTCGELARNHKAPQVSLSTTLKTIVYTISEGRLGACCVLSDEGQLQGIITDGDIRRILESEGNIYELEACQLMTSNPKYVFDVDKVTYALDIMAEYNITQLVVLSENKDYLGMIHIHDIHKEGIHF